jgi:hypothetical protein
VTFFVITPIRRPKPFKMMEFTVSGVGGAVQNERIYQIRSKLNKYGIMRCFKGRKARLWRPDFLMDGQLGERSEGVQAQWQTALGVVMAAGS